jgi:hypothetical protein
MHACAQASLCVSDKWHSCMSPARPSRPSPGIVWSPEQRQHEQQSRQVQASALATELAPVLIGLLQVVLTGTQWYCCCHCHCHWHGHWFCTGSALALLSPRMRECDHMLKSPCANTNPSITALILVLCQSLSLLSFLLCVHDPPLPPSKVVVSLPLPPALIPTAQQTSSSPTPASPGMCNRCSNPHTHFPRYV